MQAVCLIRVGNLLAEGRALLFCEQGGREASDRVSGLLCVMEIHEGPFCLVAIWCLRGSAFRRAVSPLFHEVSGTGEKGCLEVDEMPRVRPVARGR